MSPETSMITIHAEGLVAIIRSVTKFAGEGCEWSATETSVDGVVVDVRDDTLIMRATNRYVMAQATLGCVGSLEHAVIVNAEKLKSAAKTLAGIIPDDYLDPPMATLNVGTEEIAIALDETTIVIPIDKRGWVTITEETDPIRIARAGSGSGLNVTIGVGGHWMRKLAKIASNGNPMRFSFNGPHVPILCEIGDWFVAAIMPIRLSDGEINRRAPIFGLRLPAPGVSPEESSAAVPADAGMSTKETS